MRRGNLVAVHRQAATAASTGGSDRL
jgi:hypothetical protein